MPINPASLYVSEVREGTGTPDETLQRNSRGIPDWVVGGHNHKFSPIKINPGTSVTLIDCGFAGWGEPPVHVSNGTADCRFQDGLILSLSTRLDGGVAERLGKVACVRILSMPRLIATLNKQIGTTAKSGLVEYRDGYARNHFLKATADQWQQEYRLLWITDDARSREVELPEGIATRVYW